MLSNNNLDSPTYIDSRLHNWSLFNMWTSSTPKTATTSGFRYNSGSDVSSLSAKTGTNGGAYIKLF